MTEVTVPGRTPGGHYSFAARHGGLIFTAGHLPAGPDGRHMPEAGFEEQVARVFGNLFDTLAAAGAGPADVLKITAYIAGLEHWAAFNMLFARAFGDNRPARTVIPVPDLHYGYLIEIEAIAAAPDS